jgi:hypothetical protein
MYTAILIFDAKHVYAKDKSNGKDLFTPFRIDIFNKFVSDRLLHLIQENIIQKGIDIEEVLFHSNEGILMPNEIYNSEKKKDYFKLNYGDIPEEKIVADHKLNSIEAFFISSETKWWIEFCKINLPETKVNNSSVKYMDKVLISNNEKFDIHILIKEESFDIIKLQNQKLYSFNSIAYNTMTDVIYFLVAHLNKLSFDVKHLVFYGNKKDGAEINSLFSKIQSLKNLEQTIRSQEELIQFLA